MRLMKLREAAMAEVAARDAAEDQYAKDKARGATVRFVEPGDHLTIRVMYREQVLWLINTGTVRGAWIDETVDEGQRWSGVVGHDDIRIEAVAVNDGEADDGEADDGEADDGEADDGEAGFDVAELTKYVHTIHPYEIDGLPAAYQRQVAEALRVEYGTMQEARMALEERSRRAAPEDPTCHERVTDHRFKKWLGRR